MKTSTFEESEAIPTILLIRNRLFREGLQHLLSENAYSILDQGADLDDIDTGRPLNSANKPIVIIFDNTGNNSKISTQINRIKKAFQICKLIIIAHDPSAKDLKDCLEWGADGYLLPDISMEVFLDSVRLVTLGQNVFPANLAIWTEDDESDDRFQSQGGSKNVSVKELSEEERYVLQMLVAGMSNKEMEKFLCIPEEKVKVLLYRVLRKIGASNRVQGAVWAVRKGISAYEPAKISDENLANEEADAGKTEPGQARRIGEII